MTLRWGMDATAKQIDKAASVPVDELDESTADCLNAMRRRAQMFVDAGGAVTLAEFAALSETEMMFLIEAAERRRAIERRFSAEIAGHPNPLQFLPDTDPEFARAKAVAEHERVYTERISGKASLNAGNS